LQKNNFKLSGTGSFLFYEVLPEPNTNPSPMLFSILFEKGKKNFDCPNKYPKAINIKGYSGNTKTNKTG